MLDGLADFQHLFRRSVQLFLTNFVVFLQEMAERKHVRQIILQTFRGGIAVNAIFQ